MQLPSCVPRPFDQCRFDTHVDVFELDLPAGPGVALLSDLGLDLIKALVDRGQIVWRNQTNFLQHRGVGFGPADVVRVQAFVIVQRRDESRCEGVGLATVGLGVFPRLA